jgi:hypothetical protein
VTTDRLETILEQARQLSPDELAQLIKRATDMLAQSQMSTTAPVPRYVEMFGSGKGSFATQEEADRFIRQERDSWAE